MRKFSFSHKEKVLKPTEFQLIYKKGKRFSTHHFIWFFLADEAGGSLRRLGITVVKGVGRANTRNRIKRQVREFFRLNKGGFPEGAVVVKARFGAGKAENSSLREDLARGLVRLNRRGMI